MRHFDIITLFPEMFDALTKSGVTSRARHRGVYDLVCWNPRDFSENSRKSVDDRPFGGGAGMVMTPGPLVRAARAALCRQKSKGIKRIASVYLTPQGKPLKQRVVEELLDYEGLIFLAGRYEGIDERVVEECVDIEISIGDYVCSGGELPVMVLLDSLIRLLPGVLNQPNSVTEESHTFGLLEYPQYTRPETFNGKGVPEVLVSGNHDEITKWRRKQSVLRTHRRRPDLLATIDLERSELEMLEKLDNDKD